MERAGAGAAGAVGGGAHRGAFGPALEPPAAPREGRERSTSSCACWWDCEGDRAMGRGGRSTPAGGVGLRGGSAMPWAARTPLFSI